MGERISVYGNTLYQGRADLNASAAALLKDLHGMLLAQQRNYWSTHQQVSGPNYYGDHLLFERLYTGITDQIDALGERMVAMFGPAAVDNTDSTRRMTSYLDRWSHQSDRIARALTSELELQGQIKAAYDGLKASGALSLGMDDFLMALANEHDTNSYLLRQRAGS